MGALAYLTPLMALLFLLCPPMSNSRFVRFHCYQCLFLTLAAAAAAAGFVGTLSYSVVGVESPFPVVWVILPVALEIAFLTGLILAAYRAWHGEGTEAPAVGQPCRAVRPNPNREPSAGIGTGCKRGTAPAVTRMKRSRQMARRPRAETVADRPDGVETDPLRIP